MIIKGVFRRYERWNPVHPTWGAFWGMGIGVGCGVGWGPGFGPEVIGYVGAGCGIGFSVGITLAGVGIGLPLPAFANFPFQLPYNAFVTTRTWALGGLTRSTGLFSSSNNKIVPPVGWNSQLSVLGNEATARLSTMLRRLPPQTHTCSSSLREALERFKFHPRHPKGAGTK